MSEPSPFSLPVKDVQDAVYLQYFEDQKVFRMMYRKEVEGEVFARGYEFTREESEQDARGEGLVCARVWLLACAKLEGNIGLED